MPENISNNIKQSLREIPDFPKPGINFFDITTVLQNGGLFSEIIEVLAARYRDKKVDSIIGLESRGFIFAAPLAAKLGVGFIPVRKPGKLPYKIESVDFDTEYSTDTLQIHQDAISAGDRVVIVDDLLATGGTASAAIELVSRLGGEVEECAFIIELMFLSGRAKLGDAPIYSMLQCED